MHQHTFIYDENTALAKTTGGRVRGYFWDGLTIFKGIPYGTAKRFHRPQPKTWEGTLDCTSFGYVCPLLAPDKPSGELLIPHRYWPQSEDCLNLNIWTPGMDDAERPVMVWIHGGGFFAGSSIEHIAYEGENMAREGGCVVVSLNHRLNILGYLDLSDFGDEYENSGNAGTDDLILALRWIRDNIRAFGGDPDNVTLFGQSGGGMKITALLQSPEADGLFQRGIIMSGIIGSVLADQNGSGKVLAEALMQELHLKDVKEMETAPYPELARVYNKIKPELEKRGEYVGCAPHKNAHYFGDPLKYGFRKETIGVPLVAGSVFGEFTSFASNQKFPDNLTKEESRNIIAKVTGEEGADALIPLFEKAYPERRLTDLLYLDFIFRAPEQKYIRLRAQQGGIIYSYLFNKDAKINGRQMPWHCSDIPYLFHNISLVPYTQPDYAINKKIEYEIFGSAMHFARHDSPDGVLPSGASWKPSTEKDEYTAIFGVNTRVARNFDRELIPLLEKYMGPVLQKKMQESESEIKH